MSDNRYAGLSAGIFLIGLGLIMLAPGVNLWPWILVVIGLAGLPTALAAKRGWLGWQGAFWMIGLAVLFWSRRFWPGILIMIGLSVLLGGLYRGAERATSDSVEPFASGVEPAESDALPFEASDPWHGDKRTEGQENTKGDTRRL